jgi:predicted RNase H-like HicB family nuclease
MLKRRDVAGLRRASGDAMLTEYLDAAMRRARYEILPDDSTFYGEIPGLDGVYANADTLETCRDELRAVLEGWLLLRVSRGLPIPAIGGITLIVGEAV